MVSLALAAMETEHTPVAAHAPATPLDLDAIERDLADVEVALARLDAGTYWSDEVTGAELPAALLLATPTARRAASTPLWVRLREYAAVTARP